MIEKKFHGYGVDLGHTFLNTTDFMAVGQRQLIKNNIFLSNSTSSPLYLFGVSNYYTLDQLNIYILDCYQNKASSKHLIRFYEHQFNKK